MKLVSVLLENFQCHKVFELNLVDGLNVVVGQTDRGKSAIVRAIRWALFNDPPGEAFRKQGTKRTRVVLWFDSGQVLERIRGKNLNRLILDGQQYDNFGREIPEAVKEALGLWYADLAGSKLILNIALQHEPAFMLAGWQGSSRAAVLDKLCGNDIVGEIVRGLNRDVQSLGRDQKSVEDRILTLTSELEQFDHVDKALEKVGKMEKLLDVIKAREEKLAKVQELQEQSFSASVKCAQLQPRLKRLEVVLPVEQLNKRIDRLFRIKNLYDKSVQLMDQLRETHDRKPAEASVDLAGWDLKITRLDSLERLLKDSNRLWGRLKDLARNEKEAEREHMETLVEYREFILEHETCPMCSQELTGDRLLQLAGDEHGTRYQGTRGDTVGRREARGGDSS